jgi:hypothetical protein
MDIAGGIIKLSMLADKIEQAYVPENPEDLYSPQNEQLRAEVEEIRQKAGETLHYAFNNKAAVCKAIVDDIKNQCNDASEAMNKGDYFEAGRKGVKPVIDVATTLAGGASAVKLSVAVGKGIAKLSAKSGKAIGSVATKTVINTARKFPKDPHVTFQYKMQAEKAAFQEAVANGELTRKGVPIIPKTASNAVKGAGAESVPRGINGYFLGESLPCKLPGNRGPDGVFLKKAADGSVEKIFITETKYQAKGGPPKLSMTKTKGLQMSEFWIEKNLKAMESSGDSAVRETARLIKINKEKLVYKANVVTPDGTNKWYTVKPTKDGVIINPPRAPPNPRPK